MSEGNPSPIVLVDAPEDGGCEEHGWVEASVDVTHARDALAECCTDRDGNSPYRPRGRARKVTLAPTGTDDETRWHPVGDIERIVTERNADLVADGEPPLAADLDAYIAARRGEAVEFWRIEVYGDDDESADS